MAALFEIIVLAALSTAPDTLFVEEFAVGSFRKAVCLQTNPQGWLYVVDRELNQIHAGKSFDSLSQSVGGYGWTSSTFDGPTGIATDGLNVFVSDYGNHRIQRFDRNLAFLSTLATRDTSVQEARFGYPVGVALSSSGELFVLDGENYRVLRFSQDGRFQQTFGGIETGNRKIRNPLKIVVSEDNTVYVAEPDRILEFDYFGNLVAVLGDGVLGDVRSFCVTGDFLVILTRDSLVWLSRSGVVSTRILLSSLLTSEPLQNPQDLVVTGQRMLLLDTRRLYVFSIATR